MSRAERGGIPDRKKPIAEKTELPEFLQEARASIKELLKGESAEASIRAMGTVYHKAVSIIAEQNPAMNTYEYACILAQIVPERVPQKAHRAAVQALGSDYGKEVLLLLNMKTLLTVTAPYMRVLADVPNEQEELIHTVIAAVISYCGKESIDEQRAPMSTRMYEYAKKGVAEYFMFRESMLIGTRDHWNLHRVWENAAYLLADPASVTNADVTQLAEDLSQETGIPVSRLREYFIRQITTYRLRADELSMDFDVIWREVGRRDDIQQTVHTALDVLSVQQRNIVELGFGLTNEEELTQSDIAKKLNISLTMVSQLQSRAELKLHHPSIAIGLKQHYFLGDDVPRVLAPQEGRDTRFGRTFEEPYYQVKPMRKSDQPPFSIERLAIFPAVRRVLLRKGVRTIGDLFAQPPKELTQQLGWLAQHVEETLLEVLEDQYTEAIRGRRVTDSSLIDHISRAIWISTYRYDILDAMEEDERYLFLTFLQDNRELRPWMLQKIFITAYEKLSDEIYRTTIAPLPEDRDSEE